MRSFTRHFIATLLCVMIFTLTGTIDGFLRVLQTTPHLNAGASLVFTGFLNFMLVSMLSLVVLTPVTAIADYLFTHKWPFSPYIQVPLLLPLLVAYLLPWTLLLGRPFFVVLLSGTVGLTLPLLLYWSVYRVLDRDYAA